MIPRCFNRGRQTAVIDQGRFARKVLQAVSSLRETDLVCEVMQSLTGASSRGWCWFCSLSASCLFLVSSSRLRPGSALLCLFVVVFFPRGISLTPEHKWPTAGLTQLYEQSRQRDIHLTAAPPPEIKTHHISFLCKAENTV